ncbi:sugar porter family MFS transporter [Jejuia spongiicola]|uniref:Sugar porter family MFS transporter n=1 Tax=Jejuia spongiicola TaxID=2942207 RepID=A0ABT0QHW9_9FLAO|nr:sugar porter family MFS transporter [Jejuia spongiicola]MCL6296572.1 sugar porter family MFS transporter [Jejuia spongiicola]
MNKIFIWSFTVSLAGFLFGFDTIVISGADKTLQNIWGSSDLFHGMVVMAMALWGTVIGAIFGGIPTNRIGRKNTLIWIGVLYFVSAIGSATVNDPYTFAFFRFIGGLGVGASTIAAPAYISEIAPAKKRGRLVAMYQFSIVFGVLVAFISNYLLSNLGENAWRWMIGVEAFPAFIFCLLIFRVPKSPRWLITKGKINEAIKTLKIIDPQKDIELFIKSINLDTPKNNEHIFLKKYRIPLLLAFFIAFFNQFSGINAFWYYAPRILEEAGLGTSSALLSSVGIGFINVVFTLLGVYLIDRSGRKKLMYIGSFGYILSLGLVAAAFFFNWGGIVIVTCFFVFVAAHAMGQGTVIWVFISELFPNHLRASGQAFGSSVHWVLAAAIPSLIPSLFSIIGPGVVFAFFAVMMIWQLIWVHFKMPETKGKSLEKLSKNLTETL